MLAKQGQDAPQFTVQPNSGVAAASSVERARFTNIGGCGLGEPRLHSS
jgi:hypothetical protein